MMPFGCPFLDPQLNRTALIYRCPDYYVVGIASGLHSEVDIQILLVMGEDSLVAVIYLFPHY